MAYTGLMPLEIYIYLLIAIVLILLTLTIYYRFKIRNIYKRFTKIPDILSSGISGSSNNNFITSIEHKSSRLNTYNGFQNIKGLVDNISEQFKRNSKLTDTILDSVSMGIIIM
jgi:hypothetical protein